MHRNINASTKAEGVVPSSHLPGLGDSSSAARFDRKQLADGRWVVFDARSKRIRAIYDGENADENSQDELAALEAEVEQKTIGEASRPYRRRLKAVDAGAGVFYLTFQVPDLVDRQGEIFRPAEIAKTKQSIHQKWIGKQIPILVDLNHDTAPLGEVTLIDTIIAEMDVDFPSGKVVKGQHLAKVYAEPEMRPLLRQLEGASLFGWSSHTLIPFDADPTLKVAELSDFDMTKLALVVKGFTPAVEGEDAELSNLTAQAVTALEKGEGDYLTVAADALRAAAMAYQTANPEIAARISELEELLREMIASEIASDAAQTAEHMEETATAVAASVRTLASGRVLSRKAQEILTDLEKAIRIVMKRIKELRAMEPTRVVASGGLAGVAKGVHSALTRMAKTGAMDLSKLITPSAALANLAGLIDSKKVEYEDVAGSLGAAATTLVAGLSALGAADLAAEVQEALDALVMSPEQVEEEKRVRGFAERLTKALETEPEPEDTQAPESKMTWSDTDSDYIYEVRSDEMSGEPTFQELDYGDGRVLWQVLGMPAGETELVTWGYMFPRMTFTEEEAHTWIADNIIAAAAEEEEGPDVVARVRVAASARVFGAPGVTDDVVGYTYRVLPNGGISVTGTCILLQEGPFRKKNLRTGRWVKERRTVTPDLIHELVKTQAWAKGRLELDHPGKADLRDHPVGKAATVVGELVGKLFERRCPKTGDWQLLSRFDLDGEPAARRMANAKDLGKPAPYDLSIDGDIFNTHEQKKIFIAGGKVALEKSTDGSIPLRVPGVLHAIALVQHGASEGAGFRAAASAGTT